MSYAEKFWCKDLAMYSKYMAENIKNYKAYIKRMDGVPKISIDELDEIKKNIQAIQKILDLNGVNDKTVLTRENNDNTNRGT